MSTAETDYTDEDLIWDGPSTLARLARYDRDQAVSAAERRDEENVR